MKRLLVTAALASAVLGVGVAPAAATNECRGLVVCVPVVGPWIVVPTGRTVPRPRVEYQLSCPRGYIVGGLDAELSDRAIDVFFQAKIGAPVNPGVSTSRAAVFVGTYTGGSPLAPSFRPHVGCMPATGGGVRIPTTASRIFPPGQPTVRHVKNSFVGPRHGSLTIGCNGGGRLIAAAHAVGFRTVDPPGVRVAQSVRVRQTVRRGLVVAEISRNRAALAFSPVVQVSAICAGEAR